MAGTFGAVVRGEGRRCILSNNHVLADENALALKSPIFQPGLLDGGNPTADQIAKLTRFVPLRAGVDNKVDCAIAEEVEPNLLNPRFLPKIGKLHNPQPLDAVETMHVMKVGRTTGFTTGIVTDVSVDLQIEYAQGVLNFTDQIFIKGDDGQPFSAAGDSGSIIVDMKTRRPVALLFAGSPAFTAANPLPDVLAALDVEVVA